MTATLPTSHAVPRPPVKLSARLPASAMDSGSHATAASNAGFATVRNRVSDGASATAAPAVAHSTTADLATPCSAPGVGPRWFAHSRDQWNDVYDPDRIALAVTEMRDLIALLENRTGRKFEPV